MGVTAAQQDQEFEVTLGYISSSRHSIHEALSPKIKLDMVVHTFDFSTWEVHYQVPGQQ